MNDWRFFDPSRLQQMIDSSGLDPVAISEAQRALQGRRDDVRGGAVSKSALQHLYGIRLSRPGFKIDTVVGARTFLANLAAYEGDKVLIVALNVVGRGVGVFIGLDPERVIAVLAADDARSVGGPS